ncbi:MAG: FxsA family protein [Gammaproteobacteria bacterium]
MNLFAPWLLLFLLVPLLEIYVLIKVGGIIGAVPTIALIVFSAVLGSLLVRHQGFYTLARVRESMERGEVPAVPMLEGALLLLGGFLLLLPGFITDVVGLLMLVPWVRRRLVLWFLRHSAGGPGAPGPGPGPGERGPRTIEGDYRRED